LFDFERVETDRPGVSYKRGCYWLNMFEYGSCEQHQRSLVFNLLALAVRSARSTAYQTLLCRL
jgi:hypothetical protein